MCKRDFLKRNWEMKKADSNIFDKGYLCKYRILLRFPKPSRWRYHGNLYRCLRNLQFSTLRLYFMSLSLMYNINRTLGLLLFSIIIKKIKTTKKYYIVEEFFCRYFFFFIFVARRRFRRREKSLLYWSERADCPKCSTSGIAIFDLTKCHRLPLR